ncbi:MAG: isocitrate/isopropylmalate dehydrogenase family protein [Elusimicrobia bacterium]|nr:isocitrate/isopropylmalate dehydrogenase family protein [Elusimicrobiota bacterium]
MSYRVTLIPGDGTGPEIADVTKNVLEATGVKIQWDVVEVGGAAMAKQGTPLPKEVLDSIRKNKVALKGPITTPVGTGFRSVNVALRHELDLYACLRPCKLYPGVRSRYNQVDLVIVRENSEDLYTGVEFPPDSAEAKQVAQWGKGKVKPGSAISVKHISSVATERIVKFAFEYALKYKRRKVTAITKANILKLTDGLFLATTRKVAEGYKGKVEYEEKLIDNMCMQLVIKPEIYDVLVLPNLYGDILSDECAGLVGGLGVAPGANYGDGIALFEAVHGSAPKYTGLNKVNPTALILSGMMMLEYLGEVRAAQQLEKAVAEVIKEGRQVTYDLGGSAGTKEMGQAIIQKLSRQTTAV